MEKCLFCNIVKGEIPSYLIDENEEFMAFLDLFPVKEGQTLIIPKIHIGSSFSEVPDELLSSTIKYAKKISKMLEDRLDSERIFIVIQGLGVDHFHIKLYPYQSGESEDLSTTPPDSPKPGEVLEALRSKILNR